MENLEIAYQRIEACKKQGKDILRLTNLDLTNRELTQLIPIIKKRLPHLRYLNLSRKLLSDLPINFKKLRKLDSLVLYGDSFKATTSIWD